MNATRTVLCRKYQTELEGLDNPPLPGPTGEAIFESVSKKAWLEWQTVQTMLINEQALDLRDPAAIDAISQRVPQHVQGVRVVRLAGQDGAQVPFQGDEIVLYRQALSR